MDYFKDEPWNAVDINLYTLIEFEKPHVGKVWVPVLKTEDERLRKTISDPRIYGAIIDSKWKAWEGERHNRIAQYRLTHPYNAASDFFANPVPEPPTSSSSQAESDTECSTFDTFANPITEHSSFAESQAEGYSPFEVDETLTQASTSSASSRRGKKRAYAGTTEAADVFDWTDKAIRCMLAIRLSENQKFSNSTEAQSTLWRNVAIKMKEHGYTLDGPTASMKFRNMQKTYKVNKLRQSKTGQGADCVNWPYFEQFEDKNQK
ncbi:uncharacterized protein LOC128092903 [Culex pipiens pallens]|uniref:uncharacterized protein LOC128092903 n=1 Tax=Culex pipiens pallens TaxID=42434 RepID=UPI0022A9FF99|nr:uncharacterized protein LOC128092903 [Culex pipiens pallens]